MSLIANLRQLLRRMISIEPLETQQDEPSGSTSNNNDTQPVFIAPFVHTNPTSSNQQRPWYIRAALWNYFNIFIYTYVVIEFVLFALILFFYFNLLIPWVPIGAAVLLFGSTNVKWAKSAKVNVVAIILQILSVLLCLILSIVSIVAFVRSGLPFELYKFRIIFFSLGIFVYSFGAILATLLWQKSKIVELDEQDPNSAPRTAYFTVVNRPVAVELNLAPTSPNNSNNDAVNNSNQPNSQPTTSVVPNGNVTHNQPVRHLSMSQPTSISVISVQSQETQTENIE